MGKKNRKVVSSLAGIINSIASAVGENTKAIKVLQDALAETNKQAARLGCAAEALHETAAQGALKPAQDPIWRVIMRRDASSDIAIEFRQVNEPTADEIYAKFISECGKDCYTLSKRIEVFQSNE
jgi:hypothetical protein